LLNWGGAHPVAATRFATDAQTADLDHRPMTHPRRDRLLRLVRDELVAYTAERGAPPCWAVAYSGGPDSLALLHAVLHTVDDSAVVVAVHVNHRARPGATNTAVQCERLAADWGARFIGLGPRTPPGRRDEQSLRAIRYAAFEAAVARLPEGTPLLLAHTADDQAENVLVRLIRGAGLTGLAPMERLADPYFRPMLAVTRADVLASLEAAGIAEAAIHDPTNDDRSNLRSRLRRNVLPLLEHENPQVKAHLVTVATQAAVLKALLDREVERLAAERIGPTDTSGAPARRQGSRAIGATTDGLSIDLTDLDDFRAGALIRHALARLGCPRPPSLERVTAALALVNPPGPKGRVVQLGRGFTAVSLGRSLLEIRTRG
jgi:tRNA(Ile)-lysidine synthetase-like protein